MAGGLLALPRSPMSALKSRNPPPCRPARFPYHVQTGAAAPSILKGLHHSAQRWTAGGEGATVLRWDSAENDDQL